MNNLSRLLQEIKDNPVMYIDKPSITHLSSFVRGWYLSQINHFGLNPQGYPMEGFDEWMQSWAKIILFFSFVRLAATSSRQALTDTKLRISLTGASHPLAQPDACRLQIDTLLNKAAQTPQNVLI